MQQAFSYMRFCFAPGPESHYPEMPARQAVSRLDLNPCCVRVAPPRSRSCRCLAMESSQSRRRFQTPRAMLPVNCWQSGHPLLFRPTICPVTGQHSMARSHPHHCCLGNHHPAFRQACHPAFRQAFRQAFRPAFRPAFCQTFLPALHPVALHQVLMRRLVLARRDLRSDRQRHRRSRRLPRLAACK